MELLSSTASSVLYCGNQATAHNQSNYAMKQAAVSINSMLNSIVDDKEKLELVRCFQELAEASLLQQIARSMSNQKSSEAEEPKVVHVGNKPTRQKEFIDYASMPQIVCVKNEMESLTAQTTASVASKKNKRRFSEDLCSDETDSSYDYTNQKRSRYSCLSELTSDVKVSAEDMSERKLWALACKYNNLHEYRLVALALGVDEADIQVIEAKHLVRDGPRECLYQCLLTWRLNQPDSCSLERFMAALRLELNKSDEDIHRLQQQLESNGDESQCKVVLGQYLNKYGLADSYDLKLDESHLWDGSGLMAQQWKFIGRTLGLSELDLDTIEAKYLFTEGIRECCYQTLLLWSQIDYSRASLGYFCMKLIGMKFNLFAKQLIEVIASC